MCINGGNHMISRVHVIDIVENAEEPCGTLCANLFNTICLFIRMYLHLCIHIGI